VESRVQRDQKPTPNRRRVNHIYQNFRNFPLRHNFYRLSGLYYLVRAKRPQRKAFL
jgi:hypothetical protein